MAIIGLFQCDPWCLPRQNWLQIANSDINSEISHTITHIKFVGWIKLGTFIELQS